MPPVAAASVVFMATCAAKAPSLPDFMVSVEPGLKPYQPNLRNSMSERIQSWRDTGQKCDNQEQGANQRNLEDIPK